MENYTNEHLKEIENLKNILTVTNYEYETYKQTVKQNEIQFIESVSEKFTQQMNEILKLEKNKLQKYFIKRIDLLCRNITKNHNAECLKLMNRIKMLEEKVEELEIKNEFYKMKK